MRADPRVLLVGYNGANNTGAEALLLADIDDIRAVLGPGARLTIPAIEPGNLARYVGDLPGVDIVPLPMVNLYAVRRLVREHDLVILVEGHTYMDSGASALLWYFMWATRCAHAAGRPCLAYAVDAGELKPRNRRLVRRIAPLTDLIIVRSRAAADRLRDMGVDAPIEVTADNAFRFEPRASDAAWVRAVWPEGGAAPVGIAAVDYHLWPVVIRPWGRRADRYRWPYHYSRSPARRAGSAALAEGFARLADAIVERHDRSVALICMEELDETLAERIRMGMVHAERARVFSSREHDASRMTALLRSLGALVTSRYHASVLSLAAGVPQVGLVQDLRLETLFDEMGLRRLSVSPGGEMFEALRARVDEVLADDGSLRARLRAEYDRHLRAARRNLELLSAFLAEHGWRTREWAA
ncbi:MAG TPA: polysaccharide pyruvyl transferase family protein [Actinomycetota bacterium]|nr:polysaccharide pyruvyl transferase family protein [Actinomycetota bacterium]